MSDLHLNEVILRGHLGGRERRAGHGEGDWHVFQLVIRRPDGQPRGGPAVDVITIRVPATEALAEAIEGLQTGDVVDVRGRLRRRHWRTGSGTAVVLEVIGHAVAKVPDTVVAAATTPEPQQA